MQIIIEIPEELKQKIDEGFTNQVIINKLWDAAKNGTPLPKGHGRLIDAGEIIGKIHGVRSITAVLDAPTIIEADKESEE